MQQHRADFVVSLECGASSRLDSYCALVCGVARSRLKNGLISASVDGKPAKLSRLVKAGNAVSLLWADPVPESISPEDIPLDVLFENDDVAVINKPSGMVVHPAAGNWSGTLVNALLFRWALQGGSSPSFEGACGEEAVRPGIVHRLDKDTSGAIIAAKSPEAAKFLQDEFKARRVKKIYVAILRGLPPQKRGVVENLIFRDPKSRIRFACADASSTAACLPTGRAGKRAKTAYKVIAEYGDYAAVLFRIYTGRTHQIRVHARFLGCPVLGDPLYGRQGEHPPMMLHSLSLAIRLPGDESATTFRAPLPEYFREAIRSLKRCGKPHCPRGEAAGRQK